MAYRGIQPERVPPIDMQDTIEYKPEHGWYRHPRSFAHRTQGQLRRGRKCLTDFFALRGRHVNTAIAQYKADVRQAGLGVDLRGCLKSSASLQRQGAS